MSRRGSRPIIFVCGGISASGDLIMETITASVQADAVSLFKDKYGSSPKNVLGPFYSKKTQILENTTNLKFTSEVKKAEYNGWYVNAMMLKDPVNHAFLIFNGRIDGKQMAAPKGTIVVPCSSLRIIQDVK
jgi:hypothetical protein